MSSWPWRWAGRSARRSRARCTSARPPRRSISASWRRVSRPACWSTGRPCPSIRTGRKARKPPPPITPACELIDQYAPKGKQIPILSAEWGYSAAWKDFDETKQGKMLPRQWLVNLANDVPLSIWYDWHDDGTDPKEPEHHFGTVQHVSRGPRAGVRSQAGLPGGGDAHDRCWAASSSTTAAAPAAAMITCCFCQGPGGPAGGLDRIGFGPHGGGRRPGGLIQGHRAHGASVAAVGCWADGTEHSLERCAVIPGARSGRRPLAAGGGGTVR